MPPCEEGELTITRTDLHLLAEGLDDIVVGGMDHRRVAQAAHMQHFKRALEAFLHAVYHKVGQHRAELLAGERVFRADGRKLRDQDFRFFRHLDAACSAIQLALLPTTSGLTACFWALMT